MSLCLEISSLFLLLDPVLVDRVSECYVHGLLIILFNCIYRSINVGLWRSLCFCLAFHYLYSVNFSDSVYCNEGIFGNFSDIKDGQGDYNPYLMYCFFVLRIPIDRKSVV